MDSDVSNSYRLAAAIIERAKIDAGMAPRDTKTIPKTCEEIDPWHPSRQCARDFLDYLNTFVQEHSNADASEIALEVFHYVLR